VIAADDNVDAERLAQIRKNAAEEFHQFVLRVEKQARVFDTTLSSIADFAYAFDRAGRFIYVNQPLLKLWGLTLDQAVGKDFFELHYPAELAAKLQQQIQQVLQTGQKLTDETPYTSPAGVEGFYEYILSPVFAADGTVECVAGCIREITARRRLEQEREHSLAAAEAANRAKDHFLAVLSHELRTPLSPVVMAVSAMERDPSLPDKFRDDMAMIRRNIDLETKLIDDLLDLSRVSTGKLRLSMERVRLHELLRHALQSSVTDMSAHTLTIDADFRAVNDETHGDPARLQQVFWNLLRNAIKFTPAGGSITIRTWNAADTGDIHMEVRDTGVGIAPELLPRVFDAFEQGDSRTTRQFGGLGLGLAIAKAVVDMHGGTITAESGGKDCGAVFTVRLSVFAASAVSQTAEAAPPADISAPRPKARLLLVEDHPDTVRVLARLLRLSGFQVHTAGSVAAALQLAAKEPFDLVISDIGLPDASGYELMRQLKELHGLKGIALSGYGMEEDMRKSRDAGFIDHVTKPVNVQKLEAVIESVSRAGKEHGRTSA
jgi:PAS domain S-box-containing protein